MRFELWDRGRRQREFKGFGTGFNTFFLVINEAVKAGINLIRININHKVYNCYKKLKKISDFFFCLYIWKEMGLKI
jgi:hypothetical protein